jgi:pyridoxal phosphate enzyme (YggS family)
LIAQNLAKVENQMESAARKAGRDPKSVELVVVSKGVPLEKMVQARGVGAMVFGESRIQEADQKIAVMGHEGLRWHLIGHLQKNKVRRIFDLFDLIHSVDSLELAEAIHKESVKRDRVMPILVQVNVSGEEAKFGVAPGEVEPLLAGVSKLTGIHVEGLMTIPPLSDNPEDSRRYFARLREIRDGLIKSGIDNVSLDHLSMGMSNDFTIAIEEGATLIRVGSAIFGERVTT